MKLNSIYKVTMGTVLSAMVLISACKKDVVDPGPPPAPSPNSKLSFNFTHSVSGIQIIRDSIQFTNLSGNQYSIDNLRYLISDIRLDDFDGNFREIDEYHLININDDATTRFVVRDSIKKGSYKSVSYYLGFLEDENIRSADYADLNKESWAYPDLIDGIQAGGYYALRMNGRYIPIGDTVGKPYSIDIGAKRKVINGTNESFEPNAIIGSLSGSRFDLDSAKVEIEIRLDVAKIFERDGGNLLDLNLYESGYESDPAPTDIVSKNLIHAFSIGDIIYGSEIE